MENEEKMILTEEELRSVSGGEGNREATFWSTCPKCNYKGHLIEFEPEDFGFTCPKCGYKWR